MTPAASSAALAQLAAASTATAAAGSLAADSAATDSAVINGRVHRRVLTPSKISTPFPSCASFSHLMSGSLQAGSATGGDAGSHAADGDRPTDGGGAGAGGASRHRRTVTVNGSVMGRDSDVGGVIGEDEGEAMVEVLLEDGGEELSDEAFMELLRKATEPPKAAVAGATATVSPKDGSGKGDAEGGGSKPATPKAARVGPKWAVWRRSASAGATADTARRQQEQGAPPPPPQEQQQQHVGGPASSYPAVAVAAAEAEGAGARAAVGKTSAASASEASISASADAVGAAAKGANADAGKAAEQEHPHHDKITTNTNNKDSSNKNVLMSSPPLAALRPLLARARACMPNASMEPPWMLEAPFVPADWARVIAAADELLTRVAALECIVHSREGSRVRGGLAGAGRGGAWGLVKPEISNPKESPGKAGGEKKAGFVCDGCVV